MKGRGGAYRDRLHVSAACMRHRRLRLRPARSAARRPASTTSDCWSSSTSRRARSGAACSRRSRRRCAATTFARPGCSAASTSTSCCSSTSTGSSAAPTASTCCRSREELSQPLVVTLHTRALGADAAPGRGARPSCAREAELVIVMTETARRLLVECGACPAEKIRSCRTARRRCSAQRARSTPQAGDRVRHARHGGYDGDAGASCSRPSG